MKMFSLLFTILLLGSIGSLAAAPEMSILELSGQVEYRSAGQTWRTASAGTTLTAGDWISTGFNSRATLEVGDVQLEIRPLTRMQIEQLLEQENLQSTDLYLEVGRVRGEVRATEGVQTEFQLRSPVSTAAVRGTEFSFDGVNLNVTRGLVMMRNRRGQTQSVGGGESSAVVNDRRPRGPEFEFIRRTVVSPYTPRLIERTEGVEPPAPLTPTTATVVIEWDLP